MRQHQGRDIALIGDQAEHQRARRAAGRRHLLGDGAAHQRRWIVDQRDQRRLGLAAILVGHAGAQIGTSKRAAPEARASALAVRAQSRKRRTIMCAPAGKS
jgi:hypothetical protein